MQTLLTTNYIITCPVITIVDVKKSIHLRNLYRKNNRVDVDETTK